MLTLQDVADWLQCDIALLGDLPGRAGHAEIRKAINDAGWRYRRTVACIGVEKGGVGKTFLTINVAVALAMHGARVLLMDFDPQCCATNFLFPEDAEMEDVPTFMNVLDGGTPAIVPSRIEGLDLLPARPALRRLEHHASAAAMVAILEKFVADQAAYDAVLFDIPPFFGTLSSLCYALSDVVVLPVTPDAWSIESISLTTNDITTACRELGRRTPTFAIIPNKASPNRLSTGEVMARLREEYGDILLPFSIRESAGGLNAMNDGDNVFTRREAKSIRIPILALARHICPPARGMGPANYAEDTL
jgi:chromosome partitioning protein